MINIKKLTGNLLYLMRSYPHQSSGAVVVYAVYFLDGGYIATRLLLLLMNMLIAGTQGP